MAKKAKRRPTWKKKGPDARASFIREYSKENFDILTKSMLTYRPETEAHRIMFLKYSFLLFNK